MKQLLFILLCSQTTNAQIFTKSDIPKMSLCLVAGASDGVHETLWYHYDHFKRVHPNANDDYWNPYISSNQMNNSTLWSRTYGRAFIDGNHTTRFIDRNCMLTAVVLSGVTNRDEWWWYVVDFVKYFAARSVGFAITYKLIYK